MLQVDNSRIAFVKNQAKYTFKYPSWGQVETEERKRKHFQTDQTKDVIEDEKRIEPIEFNEWMNEWMVCIR